MMNEAWYKALPSACRVIPGVWQGNAGAAAIAEGRCNIVALCAGELQDLVLRATQILRCPLDDASPSRSELHRAGAAALHLADARRQGARVLITCHMGLNRSGLVTALTIRQILGCSGSEAVAYVQGARPGALANPAFVDVLRRLPERAMERHAAALSL